MWLADGIDHDGNTRALCRAAAGAGRRRLLGRRDAPRRRGAGHLGRHRRGGQAGGAGAARGRRITRRRAARGVGARPAAGRDGLYAGRRRDARAGHLRSAAGAQEPGDARGDRRRAVGGRGQPARRALAVAPGRPVWPAPRASRRSRCWRRCTTSSGRWRRSRRSPRAKTPIWRPPSTVSSSATSRC